MSPSKQQQLLARLASAADSDGGRDAEALHIIKQMSSEELYDALVVLHRACAKGTSHQPSRGRFSLPLGKLAQGSQGSLLDARELPSDQGSRGGITLHAFRPAEEFVTPRLSCAPAQQDQNSAGPAAVQQRPGSLVGSSGAAQVRLSRLHAAAQAEPEAGGTGGTDTDTAPTAAAAAAGPQRHALTASLDLQGVGASLQDLNLLPAAAAAAAAGVEQRPLSRIDSVDSSTFTSDLDASDGGSAASAADVAATAAGGTGPSGSSASFELFVDDDAASTTSSFAAAEAEAEAQAAAEETAAAAAVAAAGAPACSSAESVPQQQQLRLVESGPLLRPAPLSVGSAAGAQGCDGVPHLPEAESPAGSTPASLARRGAAACTADAAAAGQQQQQVAVQQPGGPGSRSSRAGSSSGSAEVRCSAALGPVSRPVACLTAFEDSAAGEGLLSTSSTPCASPHRQQQAAQSSGGLPLGPAQRRFSSSGSGAASRSSSAAAAAAADRDAGLSPAAAAGKGGSMGIGVLLAPVNALRKSLSGKPKAGKPAAPQPASNVPVPATRTEPAAAALVQPRFHSFTGTTAGSAGGGYRSPQPQATSRSPLPGAAATAAAGGSSRHIPAAHSGRAAAAAGSGSRTSTHTGSRTPTASGSRTPSGYHSPLPSTPKHHQQQQQQIQQQLQQQLQQVEQGVQWLKQQEQPASRIGAAPAAQPPDAARRGQSAIPSSPPLTPTHSRPASSASVWSVASGAAVAAAHTPQARAAAAGHGGSSRIPYAASTGAGTAGPGSGSDGRMPGFAATRQMVAAKQQRVTPSASPRATPPGSAHRTPAGSARGAGASSSKAAFMRQLAATPTHGTQEMLSAVAARLAPGSSTSASSAPCGSRSPGPGSASPSPAPGSASPAPCGGSRLPGLSAASGKHLLTGHHSQGKAAVAAAVAKAGHSRIGAGRVGAGGIAGGVARSPPPRQPCFEPAAAAAVAPRRASIAEEAPTATYTFDERVMAAAVALVQQAAAAVAGGGGGGAAAAAAAAGAAAGPSAADAGAAGGASEQLRRSHSTGSLAVLAEMAAVAETHQDVKMLRQLWQKQQDCQQRQEQQHHHHAKPRGAAGGSSCSSSSAVTPAAGAGAGSPFAPGLQQAGASNASEQHQGRSGDARAASPEQLLVPQVSESPPMRGGGRGGFGSPAEQSVSPTLLHLPGPVPSARDSFVYGQQMGRLIDRMHAALAQDAALAASALAACPNSPVCSGPASGGKLPGMAAGAGPGKAPPARRPGAAVACGAAGGRGQPASAVALGAAGGNSDDYDNPVATPPDSGERLSCSTDDSQAQQASGGVACFGLQPQQAAFSAGSGADQTTSRRLHYHGA